MRLSVSHDRLIRHAQYDWWKYIVAIGFTLAGLNLLFSSLIGGVPAHLRVDIFVVYESSPPDRVELIYLGASILETMPDQEQVNVEPLPLTERTPAAPIDKLYVQLAVQQGNIYILAREYFETYAAMKSFLPLSEAIEEGLLNVPPDAVPVYARPILEEGEGPEDIYGFDISGLKYFEAIGYEMNDPVICILRDSQNLEHTFQAVEWMLTNLKETELP